MTGIVMDRYRYVPPLAAQFSTIVGTNSENPTLTDTTGRGLNIAFGTNPASGDNVRGAFKSLNAASSQTIIARFEWMEYGWDFAGAGLAFTDGTKIIAFSHTWRGLPGYNIDFWTNNTSFSSEPLITGQNDVSSISGQAKTGVGGMEWMRVDIVSGVPTIFYVGPNGTDWLELYNTSTSSFMSSPTEVGFQITVNRNGGQMPISGTQQMFLNVLYYKDPDIVPGV